MDSEPAAPRGFDLRRAVETIDRANAYDAPLRRRTEGVAWALWGLVTALVLLAHPVALDEVSWLWSLFAFAVVWPVLGVLATSAAWRIASLSSGALRPDSRRLARLAGAAAVVLVVGFQAVWVLGDGGAHWPYVPLLVVVPWGLLAAVQWNRMTDAGRRVTVLAGAAMLALAVAYAAVAGLADGEEAVVAFAAILGGVPLAVGLAHSLRA